MPLVGSSFLRRNATLIILVVCSTIAGALLLRGGQEEKREVAVAERGVVRSLVSVSGALKPKSAATLRFGVTDVITDVVATEGMVVKSGDVLVRLAMSDLLAEQADARATLAVAEANLAELIAGAREEKRDIANTSVAIAEANLERVTTEQRKRLKSARNALLSSSLAVFPENPSQSAVPPLITGTYTCDREGAYILTAYPSTSASGISYHLSGIESGTFEGYTDAAAPLGTCGLFIQFDPSSYYGRSRWILPIPNNRSATHTTLRDAYELAKKIHDNEIGAAEQQLEKARQQRVYDTAAPRTEERARAEAEIDRARAAIARVEALIAKRVLAAPFGGVVTAVSATVGEMSDVNTFVTVLSDAPFELRVRIPEIDITKVTPGNLAEVVFDAQSDEVVSATVAFVSPIAKEIDGVAYFEAILTLDTTPPWARAGLNADVDIILNSVSDVVRVPRRFLIERGNNLFVLTKETSREQYTETPVYLIMRGNDGYVGISGIEAGTSVYLP